MKPIISYPGGKRRLAKRILPHIATIPHRCYAEPFAGALGMFLARPERAKSEAVNDIDAELINLFRVAQRHPRELCSLLDFELHSSRRFAELHNEPGRERTDVERARDYYLAIMLSFGAQGLNAGFSFQRTSRSKHHRDRLDDIMELAERLSGVHVDNLDWRQFVERYDSPETLFFCDPPYRSGGQKNYDNFSGEEIQDLADTLKNAKGRAIVTLDDHPENRSAFAGFRAQSVTRQAGIDNRQGAGRPRFKEIIFVKK